MDVRLGRHVSVFNTPYFQEARKGRHPMERRAKMKRESGETEIPSWLVACTVTTAACRLP